jgi:hypothetical protein
MIADAIICKVAGKSIPVYAGADKQLLPNSMYPTPDGAIMMNFRESDVGNCEIATTVNRNTFFEHYFSIVK